jgi:hypothetical protein
MCCYGEKNLYLGIYGDYLAQKDRKFWGPEFFTQIFRPERPEKNIAVSAPKTPKA